MTWKSLSSIFLMGIMLSRLGAVGYRLPNQDPEAIARGNAFAATADNPSAIYYNPAGITQSAGQQVSVGIYAVSPGVTYTSPSGETTKANSDLLPIPQFYYTCTLTNIPISFGLGVYAPYGEKLNWGNNTQFNTLGESGKLFYLCINPVIAWRVHDTLSIGVGPTINYSQADFTRAIGITPGISSTSVVMARAVRVKRRYFMAAASDVVVWGKLSAGHNRQLPGNVARFPVLSSGFVQRIHQLSSICRWGDFV